MLCSFSEHQIIEHINAQLSVYLTDFSLFVSFLPFSRSTMYLTKTLKQKTLLTFPFLLKFSPPSTVKPSTFPLTSFSRFCFSSLSSFSAISLMLASINSSSVVFGTGTILAFRCFLRILSSIACVFLSFCSFTFSLNFSLARFLLSIRLRTFFNFFCSSSLLLFSGCSSPSCLQIVFFVLY